MQVFPKFLNIDISSRFDRTEEEIIQLKGASVEDVDKAVSAARRAFEGPWSKLAAVERGAFLFKLAELIDRDRELLAAIDAFDNGKVSLSDYYPVLGFIATDKFADGRPTLLHWLLSADVLPDRPSAGFSDQVICGVACDANETHRVEMKLPRRDQRDDGTRDERADGDIVHGFEVAFCVRGRGLSLRGLWV